MKTAVRWCPRLHHFERSHALAPSLVGMHDFLLNCMNASNVLSFFSMQPPLVDILEALVASLMGLMPFVALAFLTFVAFSPLVIHMIAMTILLLGTLILWVLHYPRVLDVEDEPEDMSYVLKTPLIFCMDGRRE